MSDMVSVPAEKIAALREAFRVEFRRSTYYGASSGLSVWDAARAVVDAVETEDEPLCRCGHDKAAHEFEYSPVKGHCSHGGTNGVPECRCAKYRPVTTAPSPACDDAERVIAGLLAEHTHWQYAKYSEDRTTVCVCGALEIGNLLDAEAPLPPDAHRAHVASVIAAHMAAPDELRIQLRTAQDAAVKFAHERDALREQLTALRVAVIKLATKHGIESDDLYATLRAGDA